MVISFRNLSIGYFSGKEKFYGCDWEHFLETYKSLVKENFTVVETGSGNELKTREFSKYCKKLTGIDVDKSKIKNLGGNITLINGDWQKLTTYVDKESADLTISFHVLEHIENDLKALNESYEVLKPGGRLLLLTPNRTRLSKLAARVLGLGKRLDYPEHIREYTYDDLVKLFSRSRFGNCSIKGLVLGLHTGKFHLYLKESPKTLRNLVNFWEVQSIKN